MRKKLMAGLLILSMIGAGAGCTPEKVPSGGSGRSSGNGGSSSGYSEHLLQMSVSDGVPSLEGEGPYCFVGEEQGLTDFSVRLLQESFQTEENAMISPLSLMTALNMAGMGAEGETRAQLEEALGSSIGYLAVFLEGFYDRMEGRQSKLTAANSVWIRDEENRLTVKDQFIVDAEAYFDAEVFKAPFDDTTVDDINYWCSQATDGMIPQLMDTIAPEEVMHLINAITFDGDWQTPYASYETGRSTFFNADGSSTKTEFMYSTEWTYREDKSVTGFMKPYKDGFSFVALLPEYGLCTGVPLAGQEDYTLELSGEQEGDGVRGNPE